MTRPPLYPISLNILISRLISRRDPFRCMFGELFSVLTLLAIKLYQLANAFHDLCSSPKIPFDENPREISIFAVSIAGGLLFAIRFMHSLLRTVRRTEKESR